MQRLASAFSAPMKILQTFAISAVVITTLSGLEIPASAQTATDDNSSAGRARAVINYTEDAAAALRGVEARMPRSQAVPQASAEAGAEGPTISVPSSAAEPITVERDGVGVGLTIVGSNVTKSKSVPFNADTVIYPRTETGASTAVTVAPRADDTMIETYTIIHEASAPEEYRFRMALQPGERLVATGENSAVVDADGITMTTIDAPWAVDTVGRPVPFSLSVEGTDIVMTVRHQQDRFAYPIVVDPAVRVNCGIITCSVYFSRTITSQLRNPASVAPVLAAVCALVSGPAAPACLVAAGISTARLTLKAAECTGRNQCLRVRSQVGFLYCDGGRYCSSN